MMNKFYLGVASALLLLATNINATEIGYAKEKINRAYTFRLGSTTKQGQAIRLSHAKLQALKGKTIDFAEFVVGSKNTTGGTIDAFITTSLDDAPVAEGTVKITKALSKLKWTLDKPYTITGDEQELYIGFTGDIKTSYKLLISDGSYDIDGCNFAYKDGAWVDTYGMGQGSAHIYINVEGVADYPDVIMGKSNFDAYFKAGDANDISARFVNAGTTAIKSFDAKVTVGDNVSTQHFDNLTINPKDTYSFKVEGVNSDEEGQRDVRVDIVNVNGGDNDIDSSDNVSSGSVFFYPHNMERSVLVEGFTGQDCPNCPNGHLVINNAINTAEASLSDKIIEVSHHAGYYPDIFTMSEDDSYRFYYSNPASTFAPAVMVNRNADASISSFPVIQIEYANICNLIYHAAQSKPYVSLNLATELDKDTRELKVKFQIKPHTTMPTDHTLFNVFLVQDSLVAYQSNGGSDYIHNRVFRGTLTDNSWGLVVDDLTPGKVVTWEKTITIPEKIHSSYWTDDLIDGTGMYSGKYKVDQVDIATVLKNMTLVAYVAQYDNTDNSKNIVYNSVEVKLGESYKQAGFGEATAVKGVTADDQPAAISVENGKVRVQGDCSKVSVYNLAGAQVDANATLSGGVYIVKAIVGGKQIAKKVLVR